tara:strand:+ start:176 stop:1519 length:1344 start_codon:yes stop_codon:yes gene_type:complete
MPSAYLSKTFGTAATSTKIGTFSWWMKRSGNLSGEHDIIASPNGGEGGGNRAFIRLDNNNNIDFRLNNSSNTNIPTMLFRDVHAWYHCVLTINLNESAGADRLKFYVNGDLITSYSSENYPSGSLNIKWGQNGVVTDIGYDTTDGGGGHFNGQLAHVHWIDGTAYGPTTFGQTDATTGIWKPKTAPSVNYGNNGFFLKFDNSANMGLDSSGQGNNFTTTGTIIQTKDTPSNVFACLNSLHRQDDFSLANINNTFTNISTTHRMINTTLAASAGKYYAEVKATTVGGTYPQIGIVDIDKYVFNTYLGASDKGYGYLSDGRKQYNNSASSFGNSYTDGDIIGIAMDLDNNKLYFSKNGTWQNSGDPTSGSTGTGSAFDIASGVSYSFGQSSYDGGTDPVFSWNFGNGYFGVTAVASAQSPDDGNGIFEYDVPAGYRALCTKSLNAEEYS